MNEPKMDRFETWIRRREVETTERRRNRRRRRRRLSRNTTDEFRDEQIQKRRLMIYQRSQHRIPESKGRGK